MEKAEREEPAEKPPSSGDRQQNGAKRSSGSSVGNVRKARGGARSFLQHCLQFEFGLQGFIGTSMAARRLRMGKVLLTYQSMQKEKIQPTLKQGEPRIVSFKCPVRPLMLRMFLIKKVASTH
ncbi:hypothetical protein NDU88_006722 [Pleurodeles waltl]|uniref:Uncharacterized protein n=1 Tax=Pleurodeles waltl TaxID=8319 RepID=A0AAV7N385_PLEWA|nr:hypothetical protein NDU88_006722 [Pleurodeles waltl]